MHASCLHEAFGSSQSSVETGIPVVLPEPRHPRHDHPAIQMADAVVHDASTWQPWYEVYPSATEVEL